MQRIIYLFTVLGFFWIQGISSLDSQCEIVNWNEYSKVLNEINSDSHFMKFFLNSLAQMELSNVYTDSTLFGFLGHNFLLDVNLKQVKIDGLNTLSIVPIRIIQNDTFHLGLKCNNLKLKFQLDVEIKQLSQTGCAEDEENYLGFCHKKCTILTNGTHPLRIAPNICVKTQCEMDEQEQAAFCYKQCPVEYPIGVGPLCWSNCSEVYGNEYSNVGFLCSKMTWPPSIRLRESVTREGTLKYSPWNNGFGCDGFGVDNDGNCPTSYFKTCYTELLFGSIIKGKDQCNPLNIHLDATVHIHNPSSDAILQLSIAKCKSTSKTCFDFHLYDVIFGLIKKKPMEKAILSRIDNMKLHHFQLNWESFNEVQVHVQLNETQIVPEFANFMLTQVKGVLGNNASIHSQLQNLTNDAITKSVNDAIDSELKSQMLGRCDVAL